MLSDEIDCRKAVGLNPNLLRLQHFDEIDKMGAKCMSNMMRIESGLNRAQREDWLPIQIGRFLEHVLNETDPKKKLSLYACHDLTRESIHTVLPSYTGSTLKNSISKSTLKFFLAQQLFWPNFWLNFWPKSFGPTFEILLA